MVRMSASINAIVSGPSDRLARARHVRYESYTKSAERNTVGRDHYLYSGTVDYPQHFPTSSPSSTSERPATTTSAAQGSYARSSNLAESVSPIYAPLLPLVSLVRVAVLLQPYVSVSLWTQVTRSIIRAGEGYEGLTIGQKELKVNTLEFSKDTEEDT